MGNPGQRLFWQVTFCNTIVSPEHHCEAVSVYSGCPDSARCMWGAGHPCVRPDWGRHYNMDLLRFRLVDMSLCYSYTAANSDSLSEFWRRLQKLFGGPWPAQNPSIWWQHQELEPRAKDVRSRSERRQSPLTDPKPQPRRLRSVRRTVNRGP